MEAEGTNATGRPWHAHYPANVPWDLAVPDQRLHEAVGESLQRWPDRTMMVYYGARWSYAQFWEAAGRFSAALAAEGVGPGDRVALYLPNCPVYPIAFFGALRRGATVVQVSPLYIGQDLGRLLKDAEPKAVVTLEILYPNLARVRPEVTVPVAFVARLRELYPWWKRPFVNMVLRRQKLPTEVPRGPSIRRWSDAIGPRSPVPDATGDPATEVAVLQYTGGTTGRPKAAMLTHRNLLANALQCQAWFNVGEAGFPVVLCSIPFFHVYGMTVALNYPLISGATLVLQTRPDIDEILHLIQRYRPTQFPGVPALYQGINHHPKLGRYDLRSIRVCVSGSAPLPHEVEKRFEELTGGSLVEGYGLTEASPVTHANPVVGRRKTGTIGLPLPATDQRVVDLEEPSRAPPPGEAGELAVRGPQVMLGYYRHPEETALVLHDGWLLTGDVATIDDEGYVTIVDRKKDMIDVAGLKVYPREVEEVLFQHPGILDAAVIGRLDAQRGEVVHAVVVPRPGVTVTEAELIGFVRERIAHYKAPRSVEFRSSLPKSAVQKVLRRVLREESARGSGLPDAAAPTDPAR
ncbi:MAG: long-chain fatty acid--CoA ligase [Thermoplasmata archaeon]|nr:long-chain fatty acid--CoA ligase [Thermoplasmata archaeon]